MIVNIYERVNGSIVKIKSERVDNIKDIIERFKNYCIVEVISEETFRTILIYEVT